MSLGQLLFFSIGLHAHNSRGTGYIGSFTALALLEADYKVVIADNLYNSSEETLNRIELISGKRPLFYHVDIRKEEDFDKVFGENPDIDSVIHFAALKVCRFTCPRDYRNSDHANTLAPCLMLCKNM